MDGGFFERYGSGLKENFEEDTIIAEKDRFATLNEREISKVDQDTAARTQITYKELLSSLLELNVSVFLFYWNLNKNASIIICCTFIIEIIEMLSNKNSS